MDKVKAKAQEAATEGKKLTGQVQEKMGQAQLRKKMDDLAKQLGYAVYAERAKGTPAGPELDRLVGEMTAVDGQLQSFVTAEATAAPPGPAETAAPPATPSAAPPPATPSSAPPPSASGSEPPSGDYKP
ncbi:MAG TPA: hypothetical protein VHJ34_09465 [Actinomycetota bacterium]|nr:hypothetical protein [Actinomycetota bacterium]